MNNKMQHFFKENNEWEIIDEHISRQIVAYNESMMMVQVAFENGGVGELHKHFETQATYIASGTFEVTIDGTMEIIKKGHSFFVPSNVVHGVVCQEEGMLVDIFSPYRKDFI
ncbi:cupin domain-containing protein [Patiriisocius sp.]|uniref:cupin domain-containing protein n=1 Tax=Patiriisocius sp. TaxID=2822396 RepID=UPI003F4AE002